MDYFLTTEVSDREERIGGAGVALEV